MNILISLLCVFTGLFSSYLLKTFTEINVKLKTSWSEKSVYAIFTGIIVCSMSLSYALFLVWDGENNNLILLITNILIMVVIIANWIMYYFKRSNRMIMISMIWNLLVCAYIIYLFYVSFIAIE